MRWGRPRRTRGQRNSAARMRVPARRGASPRTIVSTSGSSGMLRNIDQNVVAGDLDRKRGNFNFGIVVVGARAAIELPGVPGAGETTAVDCALAERSTTMRTRSGQRVNTAIHVANRVAFFSDGDLRHRAGREPG